MRLMYSFVGSEKMPTCQSEQKSVCYKRGDVHDSRVDFMQGHKTAEYCEG